jgi:hypothetical protein
MNSADIFLVADFLFLPDMRENGISWDVTSSEFLKRQSVRVDEPHDAVMGHVALMSMRPRCLDPHAKLAVKRNQRDPGAQDSVGKRDKIVSIRQTTSDPRLRLSPCSLMQS